MAKVSANKTPSAQLVRASARQLHIAPRKMRLVTDAIKNLSAGQALAQLQHMDKKGAPMVIKLLKSALANAKNNFSLDPEKMFIKNISADMGTVMKRYFPRARGSAFVIRRKLSHVNLVLEERGKAKAGGVKLGFLQKADKEKKAEASVDQKDATNEKPTSETPKKQQLFKSEEQVKMNKVQNKRRLFNRK